MKSYLFSAEELQAYRGGIDREVPGRGGVKDYAPDGNWLQEKHLEKYYEVRREVLSEERVQIQKNLLIGEWDPERKHVELKKTVGNIVHAKGYSEDGKLLLYPEEALFLIDEGVMELYYGGVPLSLQQAFTLLLQRDLTIDQYHVYAHLSRAGLGYIVRRHITDYNITMYERKIRLDQHVKHSGNKQKRQEHEEETGTAEYMQGTSQTNEDDTIPMSTSPSPDFSISKQKRTLDKEHKDSPTPNKKLRKEQSRESRETEILANNSNVNTPEPLSKSCVDVGIDVQSELCENSKEGQNFSKKEQSEPLSRAPTLVDGALSKTRAKRDVYTNWNFSDIEFPDIAGIGDSYMLKAPDTCLLPPNLKIFKESYTLQGKVLQLNKSKMNRSHTMDLDEELEFSFLQTRTGRVKSKARNWGEYKEVLVKKVTCDDDILDSPVSCLWSGEVTPLVKPQCAVSTEAILKKLDIIENTLPLDIKRAKESKSHLKIMFDVYLPDKKFKKSMPGVPNHRIIVMSQEDPPPDLATISHFSKNCKDGAPLHWAVVDHGEVAFYSFNSVNLPKYITMG